MTTAPPKPPPPKPPPPVAKPPTPPPAATAAAPNIVMPGQKREGHPPRRIVLTAVEGWGKTTAGAFAERPFFLMARSETGYDTLLDGGLVPDIHRARVDSFDATLAMLDQLAGDFYGCKTLVMDAHGGFERLCHEAVCARDFRNPDGTLNWGETGFTSFQRGYEIALADWIKLLGRLETLRERQGCDILILSHSQIRMFNNPEGPNFDRYVADCHQKTWAHTAKWADAVLFGTFLSRVVTAGNSTKMNAKGKAQGGTERVLYTERRDTFDAKNRYGMEPAIMIPDDHTQVWATIHAAMTKGNGHESV